MEQKAFYKLSYGLYVISSKRGAHYNGQTANTVFQISSEPPTLAIGINKNNLTHEFINESKIFAISILPLSAPLNLIGHFGFKSGRVMDKFAEIPYKTGMLGIPILSDHSIGFFEAEVINQLDVGTHTVFIGRVVNSEVYRDEEPMTYAHYHLLKKGTVPPIVPEQVKERPEVKTGTQEVSGTKQNKMKEEKIMKQYACSVCGYIYDPETGDPDAGIAPGTPFENLPDDWACPVCGVGKDQFEVVE